jgi:hypothetical protein
MDNSKINAQALHNLHEIKYSQSNHVQKRHLEHMEENIIEEEY